MAVGVHDLKMELRAAKQRVTRIRGEERRCRPGARRVRQIRERLAHADFEVRQLDEQIRSVGAIEEESLVTDQERRPSRDRNGRNRAVAAGQGSALGGFGVIGYWLALAFLPVTVGNLDMEDSRRLREAIALASGGMFAAAGNIAGAWLLKLVAVRNGRG